MWSTCELAPVSTVPVPALVNIGSWKVNTPSYLKYMCVCAMVSAHVLVAVYVRTWAQISLGKASVSTIVLPLVTHQSQP